MYLFVGQHSGASGTAAFETSALIVPVPHCTFVYDKYLVL